jgi:phage terminase small subunit
MAGEKDKHREKKAAEETETGDVDTVGTPPADTKQGVLVMAQLAEDMGEVSARDHYNS